MTTNPESGTITLDELLLIQAAVEKVTRERDELRAENERLRAFVGRVVGAYAVDEWIAEEGRQLLNDESWSP